MSCEKIDVKHQNNTEEAYSKQLVLIQAIVGDDRLLTHPLFQVCSTFAIKMKSTDATPRY
jgi:hypothetical protein